MNKPRIIPFGEELPPLETEEELARKAARAKKADRPKGKAPPVAGRFALLNGFVDFSLADLSRAEIAVWLILYRDSRDGVARTSLSEIARRAGCNRGTVFRAVRDLKRRGLVKAVYRGGRSRGISRYRVQALPKEDL
jgi:hypothetical protein